MSSRASRFIFVLHVLTLPFWCLGFIILFIFISAGAWELLPCPLKIVTAPFILIGCFIVLPLASLIRGLCMGILHLVDQDEKWEAGRFPRLKGRPRWPKWKPEPPVTPVGQHVAL
ncbi:hypothetical protein RSAG8_10462, partial [Rhizoctonia solani AG-8 WAC10335]